MTEQSFQFRMARTRRHQIPENQGRISKPQAESVTEAVDMTSVQAPFLSQERQTKPPKTEGSAEREGRADQLLHTQEPQAIVKRRDEVSLWIGHFNEVFILLQVLAGTINFWGEGSGR